MRRTIHQYTVFLTLLLLLMQCHTAPKAFSEPKKAEYSFDININSVPAGAAIYTFDPTDYMLKKKIGTTPYKAEIDIARWYNSDGTLYRFKIWRYKRDKGLVATTWHNTAELNFAVVKEGYKVELIQNKVVATTRDYPPKDNHLTIPLTLSSPREGSYSDQIKRKKKLEQDLVDAMDEYAEALESYNSMVKSYISNLSVYKLGGINEQERKHLTVLRWERDNAKTRLTNAEAKVNAIRFR